jgi:hypothetical protein
MGDHDSYSSLRGGTIGAGRHAGSRPAAGKGENERSREGLRSSRVGNNERALSSSAPAPAVAAGL